MSSAKACTSPARALRLAFAGALLGTLACSGSEGSSRAGSRALPPSTLAIESEAQAYERAAARIHAGNWEKELSALEREIAEDAHIASASE